MISNRQATTKERRVSIVILNHNGLIYLKQVIPVVLTLEYVDLEIIVIDNGSSDGSLSYISQHPTIRLLQSPRFKEKNFACNFAIEHATGEYVFLMDNDVVFQDSKLIGKLVDFYQSLPTVGQIGLCLSNKGNAQCDYYGMYLGAFFTKEIPSVSFEKARSFHGREISFALGAAFFLKKETWLEVGGYDDHLAFGGDDNDLGIKLWLRGYKNYLYAESIQLHIGAAERTDLKKYLFKFRNTVKATFLTIFKEYRPEHVVLYGIMYSCFLILKSVKQAIWRKDPRPLFSPLLGWFDFLKDLPYALTMRSRSQRMRRIKEDVFLSINVPK